MVPQIVIKKKADPAFAGFFAGGHIVFDSATGKFTGRMVALESTMPFLRGIRSDLYAEEHCVYSAKLLSRAASALTTRLIASVSYPFCISQAVVFALRT